MNKFNSRIATAAMLLAAAALTACGGGSSSSSGSGSSGGMSSTLVVNSSPSLAMIHSPYQQSEETMHIAAYVFGLLMQNAWAAQLAGSEIIVFNSNGNQIEPTSEDADMLFYVVPPDSYTVCVYPISPAVAMPDDDACNEPAPVGLDSVVVVTAVADNGQTVFSVAVETREDNVALFQNPDRPNQTYICHKGTMTKSVGTPASLRGHQVHGDTLGPCENFGAEQQNTNGNNNSNERGNNNRCNKGNKLKKGCEGTNEQV